MMAETKKPKSAVRYGRGMLTRHCSVCQHWRPPRSCELVVGPIQPNGWCRLFERAKVRGKASA